MSNNSTCLWDHYTRVFEKALKLAEEAGVSEEDALIYAIEYERGFREGEERMGCLAAKLASAGRIDDAFRAASDPAFRAEMYKEFQLA